MVAPAEQHEVPVEDGVHGRAEERHQHDQHDRAPDEQQRVAPEPRADRHRVVFVEAELAAPLERQADRTRDQRERGEQERAGQRAVAQPGPGRPQEHVVPRRGGGLFDRLPRSTAAWRASSTARSRSASSTVMPSSSPSCFSPPAPVSSFSTARPEQPVEERGGDVDAPDALQRDDPGRAADEGAGELQAGRR